jgi:hypothetical protein
MAGARSTIWAEDDAMRSGGRRRSSYRSGAYDLFWNETLLLLPLDSDFKDRSKYRRYDVAAQGGAVISASQSKWGKGSAFFNGTGDGIRLRDVGLGTGDLTIELWVKSASSVQYAQLIGNENPGFTLLVNNGSSTDGQIAVYNDSLYFATSSGDYTDDSWHHVALWRSGTSLGLGVDGTRLATATSSVSFSGQDVWIGRNNAITPRNLIGYVQDVRITAACRYSGSTYTVPGKLPYGDLVRA